MINHKEEYPSGLESAVDWNLVHAVEEILPVLKKNGLEAEQLRRLPKENVDILTDLGVFRMTTPKHLGGLQANLPTTFEVNRTLATACGSTAWVSALYTVCGWWAALFPDSVQEEVFTSEKVRVAGIVSPLGTLVPTEGGYVLNGKWPWNTGVLDSQWDVVSTLRPMPDGSKMPYLVIVPTRDMKVGDDWYMSGMRGTGSNSSEAVDVFVPNERAMEFPPLLQGQHQSQRNKGAVEYSYAVFPFLIASSASAPIGMAQGALEGFLGRASNRRISFEDHRPQPQSEITQLQAAEMQMRLDSALLLARELVGKLHRYSEAGTSPSLEERAKARAIVAFTTRVSLDVVNTVTSIGGAGAFANESPAQRYHRDITMLSNHAYLNYEANLKVFGSVLLGNEITSLFL